MNRNEMLPNDEYNRVLLDNVHPLDWTNPTPSGRYNIVVIGGGTAGLITAAIASSMGARTALIERGLMGGDCLNVGCVPSKALIRGARGQAELDWLLRSGLLESSGTGVPTGARADALVGVSMPEPTISPSVSDGATRESPQVSFPAVMKRLRSIRASISTHDSPARYRDEFGVDVFIGQGTFTGRSSVTVTGDDGTTRDLTFARAVIATGARAAAPPIPGLDVTPYLTNETLFSLTERPESIAIIGAGPIGCEIAQSFARLGSRVDLIEMTPRVLPREDPDVAETVQRAIETDGVTIHLNAAVGLVSGNDTEVTVRYTAGDGSDRSVSASRLLVAIGRAPNINGLGLDVAGVRTHPRGIEVNRYLQTSNRRIYAAGDVASSFQFTHMAEATASVVVRNALFFPGARADRIVVPWSTYTSPEVAHVGLSETEAQRRNIKIDVYRHEMHAVDRARLDGETEGFVKIITRRGKTRILGATIVAAHAGELIAEIVLAIRNGLGIDKLAAVVHPYPTRAEAVKRAAAGYLRKKLTPRTKEILGMWFRWRR
ncbi:MAG: mercuric reductase [Alkalispirochaeta sp.]